MVNKQTIKTMLESIVNNIFAEKTAFNTSFFASWLSLFSEISFNAGNVNPKEIITVKYVIIDWEKTNSP